MGYPLMSIYLELLGLNTCTTLWLLPVCHQFNYPSGIKHLWFHQFMVSCQFCPSNIISAGAAESGGSSMLPCSILRNRINTLQIATKFLILFTAQSTGLFSTHYIPINAKSKKPSFNFTRPFTIHSMVNPVSAHLKLPRNMKIHSLPCLLT